MTQAPMIDGKGGSKERVGKGLKFSNQS